MIVIALKSNEDSAHVIYRLPLNTFIHYEFTLSGTIVMNVIINQFLVMIPTLRLVLILNQLVSEFPHSIYYLLVL